MKTARTCFTTWAATQLPAPFAKHPSSSRNRNRSQSQRSLSPGGAPARSPGLFQSRCTLTPGLGRFSPTASAFLCYAQPKCPALASPALCWARAGARVSSTFKTQRERGAPASFPPKKRASANADPCMRFYISAIDRHAGDVHLFCETPRLAENDVIRVPGHMGSKCRARADARVSSP